MLITNLSRSTILSTQCQKADSFFSRMKGLLGRASLLAGEGLLITRCQSIHMFFMRFSIDAIFVDKENRAVGLVPNIAPFQLSPIFLKASFVIELPAGTILQTKTLLGDQLELK